MAKDAAAATLTRTVALRLHANVATKNIILKERREGEGKKPLNHIFLSKHTIIGAVCRTAIKYRKEENQPRGELAFSMTIWHRRRRRGTKASWMDRRGECAIALTCK